MCWNSFGVQYIVASDKAVVFIASRTNVYTVMLGQVWYTQHYYCIYMSRNAPKAVVLLEV
jgi:hypothetical protein